MNEELVETVLRVVEAIPEGEAATYGMIARVVGTGPRVVGRIMAQWGESVPWWRVVSAHGTFPTSIRSSGVERWRAEGMPLRPGGEGLDLSRCLTNEERLLNVCAQIICDLRR
ncbi:MGMT family protein [Actinomyces sp. B33]|uniref:MGMT family protein n=1 Tax=Actinomyces sp. B33 TaxID=2942131 RepID=UPI00233FACDE|nr:MGMT family protein [Actinomyces sp. B33]MDC4232120.1 MGMT family protein [Actinomyces sp. B33]